MSLHEGEMKKIILDNLTTLIKRPSHKFLTFYHQAHLIVDNIALLWFSLLNKFYTNIIYTHVVYCWYWTQFSLFLSTFWDFLFLELFWTSLRITNILPMQSQVIKPARSAGFSRIKKIPYKAPPTQLGPRKCTFWKNAFLGPKYQYLDFFFFWIFF